MVQRTAPKGGSPTRAKPLNGATVYGRQCLQLIRLGAGLACLLGVGPPAAVAQLPNRLGETSDHSERYLTGQEGRGRRLYGTLVGKNERQLQIRHRPAPMDSIAAGQRFRLYYRRAAEGPASSASPPTWQGPVLLQAKAYGPRASPQDAAVLTYEASETPPARLRRAIARGENWLVKLVPASVGSEP